MKNKFVIKAIVATGLLLSGSTQAMAQAAVQPTPEAILRQAIEAQQKAAQALAEANHALAVAQELIAAQNREATQPAPIAGAASSTSTSTTPSPAPVTIPASYPGSEAACNINRETDAIIVGYPREWQRDCLGVEGQKSIFDIVALNLQLLGSNESGHVSLTPSYTWRTRFVPSEGAIDPSDPYNTRYWRLRGGIRVPLDPGKKTATFADLTTPEVTAGVQFTGGFEFGGTWQSKKVTGTDIIASVDTELRKAREDCLVARAAALDFASAPPVHDPRDMQAAQCEGTALQQWMNKNDRLKYAGQILQPVWTNSSGRQFFLGFEGTYAQPEFEFFPILDPGMSGEFALLDTLPATFPSGATTLQADEYSLKGYAGVLHAKTGRPILRDYTMGASLTYRRDFSFPAKTENQTICNGTEASFNRCFDVDIAPPVELDGFVIGGLLGASWNRIGPIPPIALELRPSYAFDTDQLGVLASLYVSTDSEGKQQGGIIFGCTTSGETPQGVLIEDDCKASLFFGTKFSLNGRP